MGNQLPTLDSISQIQNLNISPEQKKNLQIYAWRASSQNSQHIPKVVFDFEGIHSSKNQRFACLNSADYFSPNISFENYLCDFRLLKSFLTLSELITLFRFVLKGHQTIFSKFNATVVSEKCCFVTYNGEIRVWINPNYYLNDFWTFEKKQFRLRSSSAHQMNCQTPRFMNKEEFDFQTVTLMTSQSTIIRKLIQFMPQFSKKCAESWKFWNRLQNFIQDNILNNCCFDRIQRFINKFAYDNKISLKSNLQDVVSRLILQGIILQQNDNSYRPRNAKRKISLIESSYTMKEPSKINIMIDGQQNGVSVLDIKSTCKQNFYTGNQNFSRLLGTTLNEDDCFKTINKQQKQDCFELPINTKTSIKNKKFGHRRKLSKSLVQQNVQKNMVESTARQQDFPSVRSEVLQQGDEWSTKTKAKSFYCPKSSKNLNYSYQYSINLHMSQINTVREKLSNKNLNKLELSQHHNISQQNNMCSSDKLRISSNSKSGSILKKGHTKSFQICKQNNQISNNKELLSKKKHPTIIVPQKSYEMIQNNQIEKNNQLRFSNFGTNDGDFLTPNSSNLFKKFEKQQRITNINSKQQSTKRTATRTRQNSSYNLEQKYNQQHCPFKQITNQIYQTKINDIDINNASNTSIHPNLDQSKHRGQTSMLVNGRFFDDQIQQEIIRSKRRISEGRDSEIQKKLKGLSTNNMLGSMNPTTMNHMNFRTITRLISSENKLQTSIGSLTSNSDSFSGSDDKGSKYTGILTKMGRSVPFKKVADEELQKMYQFQKKISTSIQATPNFTRKKTIYQHGSNRSMKV